MKRKAELRIAALALALLGAACAGQDPAAEKVRSPKGGKPGFGPPVALGGSYLLPDVAPPRLASEAQRLVGRMRLEISPEGVIARAPDLLPAGQVAHSRLPPRMGGGFIFVAASARGTEIWRSDEWLSPLKPLTLLGRSADTSNAVKIGFDRLYVKLRSGEIAALDPGTGAPVGLGGLPPFPALGEMAFADGFRGIVETQLGGVRATFDAGATWRPLPIRDRVLHMSYTDETGDLNVLGKVGMYTLSPRGEFSLLPASEAPPVDENAAPGETRVLPLGPRPLRMALLRGGLETPDSAVVLHEGSVFRVEVGSGKIRDRRMAAYPETDARCEALEFGTGKARLGFVCGSPLGATTVYELGEQLALQRVARFEGPRRVIASGQGNLVVGGSCDEGPAASDGKTYCTIAADGTRREIRVRGAVGAERVVSLRDGSVAILLPPRPGTRGQLTLLSGSAAKHVPLTFSDSAPRDAETGLWLDGFVQSGDKELAGWIEAGGPVFGVRISLAGEVKLGPAMSEGASLLAGRYGLSFADGDRIFETSDHGDTWQEQLLPMRRDSSDVGSEGRRCSALGCVFPGYLRLGWGDPAVPHDLKDPPAPAAAKLSSMRLSSSRLALRCSAGATFREPTPNKPTAAKDVPFMNAFAGIAAPKLQKGDAGVDGGAGFGTLPFRVYAWGPKETDWSRAGRSLVRMSDPYLLEGPQNSAVTASLFNDDQQASEILGGASWGISWSAARDASGAGEILSACRGRICNLFTVAKGEPISRLRTRDLAGLTRPVSDGVVRLGRSWYFLGDETDVTGPVYGVYEAEQGVVRKVMTLPRLSVANVGHPQLVRRHRSGALGLLYTTRDGSMDRAGMRYVLPIDPQTGEAGEPVYLGRVDLSDVVVSGRCDATDGWAVELFEPVPTVGVGGRGVCSDGFRSRMRLDSERACFVAATCQGSVDRPSAGKTVKPPKATVSAVDKPLDGQSAFPVVVWGETRSQLTCSIDL